MAALACNTVFHDEPHKHAQPNGERMASFAAERPSGCQVSIASASGPAVARTQSRHASNQIAS